MLADTSMEMVLGIPFLPLSDADMGLQRAFLVESQTAEAMPFFVLLFEKLHTQRVSQPVWEKLVIHLETVKLFVTLEHLESVEHLETSTSRRAPQDRQVRQDRQVYREFATANPLSPLTRSLKFHYFSLRSGLYPDCQMSERQPWKGRGAL